MKISRLVAWLVVTLSLVALPLNAQSLLINGSFESPVAPAGGSLITYGLANWDAWAIEVVNEGLWPAAEGRQSLNLAGERGIGQTIVQTFPTIPGKTYELSFYYANHPNTYWAQASVTLSSFFGNFPGIYLVSQINHSGSTCTNMQYTQFVQQFVASNTIASLKFEHLGSSYPIGRGIILDDVVMTQLPDPDADGDGVPDDEDECPDTTPDTMVNASGCSLDQLAPCEGPTPDRGWRNHGEYVTARFHVIQQFRKEGLLNQKQANALTIEAFRSDCGRPRAGKPNRPR